MNTAFIECVRKSAAATKWGADLSPTMKAAITVDTFGSDGLIPAEMAAELYRVAIKESTSLKDVDRVTMRATQRKVPRISVTSRVLHAGARSTPTPAAAYMVPTVAGVTLDAKILKGAMAIEDEVFEDCVELEGAVNTILAMMGERISFDLGDIMWNGDTTGSDALLSAFDGIRRHASSTTYAAGGVPLDKDVLKAGWKKLDVAYRRFKPRYKFYTGADAEIDYVDSLGDRVGEAADRRVVTGEVSPTWNSIPIVGEPVLPMNLGGGTNETVGYFMDPKNAVFGFHREVKIEKTRDPYSGLDFWIVTVRCDVRLRNEAEVAEITGITVS